MRRALGSKSRLLGRACRRLGLRARGDFRVAPRPLLGLGQLPALVLDLPLRVGNLAPAPVDLGARGGVRGQARLGGGERIFRGLQLVAGALLPRRPRGRQRHGRGWPRGLGTLGWFRRRQLRRRLGRAAPDRDLRKQRDQQRCRNEQRDCDDEGLGVCG